LPNFTNNNGKVLGLTNGTPTWVVQTQPINSYMTPDYANIKNGDGQNLITANNGTWTADSLGFVYCVYQLLSSSSTPGSATVFINDKEAGKVMGTSSMGDVRTTTGNIFMVAKGDRVKLTVSGTTLGSPGCYFIPPKYSTTPTPTVVDSGAGGSYSTDEIKTADKWLNNKPIYKKTFSDIVAATSGATLGPGMPYYMGASSSLLPNLEAIVKSEVMHTTGQGTANFIDIWREGSGLNLVNNSPTTMSNLRLNVTIYYTKTTGN
jgi:hypothetical protein